MPPAKVEVAVEVEVIEPVVSDPVVRVEKMPEIPRMIVVKKLVEVALVVRRLVRVEVAVEVAVMTPVVKFPTVDDEVIEPPKNTIGEDVAE